MKEKYRNRRKNNAVRKTQKLPMGKKQKVGFLLYAILVCVLFLGTTVVLAKEGGGKDDPIAVVNNLSDFIFGLIRAIGVIILGFGIVQVGMAVKSHDPTQRANGFLTMGGGVVITFAKEILDTIMGG